MREAFAYAWHGSGRRWDAVPLQVIGGIIGGFAIWYWGLKVPPEILDNPAFGGVAAIIIGAICGALVAFVLRLCWYPVYRRYDPYGGLIPYLRAKLGVHEIERQLRAIDDIRLILSTSLQREALEGVELNQDVSQQLQAGRVRNSGVTDRLTDLSKRVEADLKKIQDIVESHADYPYFRENIKYEPFNPFAFVSSARNVAAEIRQLSADADSKYLLRSQSFVEFGSAGQNLGNWGIRCDQNLGTSRQAIEALPVYGK